MNTIVLTAPHIIYAVLYNYPNIWRTLCDRIKIHPSYALSVIGHVAKVLQGIYLYKTGQICLQNVYSLTATPRTFLSIGALCIGQTLNMSVYRALGTVGVYYGNEFGYNVPHVDGFPFRLGRLPLSHPQYWGCILSILSLPHLIRLREAPYRILMASYLMMMAVEEF